HNINLLDSFFAEDFADHDVDSTWGLKELKAGFAEWYARFPDSHAQIDYMLADGDTVMAKIRLTGTMHNPQSGQATGKSMDMQGVAIFGLKNNKIVHRWRYFDNYLM